MGPRRILRYFVQHNCPYSFYIVFFFFWVEKDVQMLKKMITISKWGVKHMLAGQNTQQLLDLFSNMVIHFPVLDNCHSIFAAYF